MSTYKHKPPLSWWNVNWSHVKDWWVNEKGNEWNDMIKYNILKSYKKVFFLSEMANVKTPAVPKKPVRYLNRV